MGLMRSHAYRNLPPSASPLSAYSEATSPSTRETRWYAELKISGTISLLARTDVLKPNSRLAEG